MDIQVITRVVWSCFAVARADILCLLVLILVYIYTFIWFFNVYFFKFLPRCMKCRRGLAMRILSVCPSVCLSVRRVICDKMEERSVHIFIPYERTFSLVYWEEEWLVADNPFYSMSQKTYPAYLAVTRESIVGFSSMLSRVIAKNVGDVFFDTVYVKFWVNRPPLERNRRF